MIDKTTFKKGFDRLLKGAGFRNKGQSWYLDGAEIGVMLNLQKSDHDEKYYLNFGIFFEALGAGDSPLYNHCPIYGRITSIYPEELAMVEKGCRIDAADDAAFLGLLAVMEEKVIPFCVECSQAELLRGKMLQDIFRPCFVRKDARDMFAA